MGPQLTDKSRVFLITWLRHWTMTEWTGIQVRPEQWSGGGGHRISDQEDEANEQGWKHEGGMGRTSWRMAVHPLLQRPDSTQYLCLLSFLLPTRCPFHR